MARFRLADGSPDVGGVAREVEPVPELMKRSIEKYGRPTFVRFARSALDYVDAFVENAKLIVRSGEQHGWFILYFRGAERVYAQALTARDKADKWSLAQQVAETALSLGVDGVIEIGEVWMGRVPTAGGPFVEPSEQPDKREAITVYAELSTGQHRSQLVPIIRSRIVPVMFGEPIEMARDQNLFLGPLRSLWARQRSAEKTGN